MSPSVSCLIVAGELADKLPDGANNGAKRTGGPVAPAGGQIPDEHALLGEPVCLVASQTSNFDLESEDQRFDGQDQTMRLVYIQESRGIHLSTLPEGRATPVG
jgi:hypothetical protein